MEKLSKNVERLLLSGLDKVLVHSNKGIEKESLRVATDGHISPLGHPAALGSALTHPYITTDYSEALLEFRTAPCSDLDAGLEFLADLHAYTWSHIEPELIWPASMPCRILTDEDVPIANYGTSNSGRMKHVYRVGLGYRYGRAMQAIAGIHFNYSLPDAFWPVWHELSESRESLRHFIDRSYFVALRNFQRYGWIISYLFGASPAMCATFARLRGGHYEQLGPHTMFGRFATSLRMSDSGYKNKSQAGLDVSYNSVDEYVRSLRRAISTVHPEYERIGVKVGEEYRQLNANILQIENEYYSFIRPKQITRSGEKPTTALLERGVQYVEVRALDVNPFQPLGMDASQLRFVEALLLTCLFDNAAEYTAEERRVIERNQTKVACCGRDPDLLLNDRGQARGVQEWAREILERVAMVCELLDRHLADKVYTHSVLQQIEAVENPDLLPASRIMRELRETGESCLQHSLRLAAEHGKHFRARKLTPERRAEFDKLAAESLHMQRELEAGDKLSFDQFLSEYFQ